METGIQFFVVKKGYASSCSIKIKQNNNFLNGEQIHISTLY